MYAYGGNERSGTGRGGEDVECETMEAFKISRPARLSGPVAASLKGASAGTVYLKMIVVCLAGQSSATGEIGQSARHRRSSRWQKKREAARRRSAEV